MFELADYIDAVYLALPLNVREWHGARQPWEKMEVIHSNYHLIDLNEMINNLVLNEIEDFAFGLLGRMSQATAQRLNLSVGPQMGQGSLRSHSREVAADIERNRDKTFDFVPDYVETFK